MNGGRFPQRIKRGSCVVTIYKTPSKGYASFTVVHYDASGARCRRMFEPHEVSVELDDQRFGGQTVNPREILRLCRRDSRSLTVPGMWVEGKCGGSWSEVQGLGCKEVVMIRLVGKQDVRMKEQCGSDGRAREREPMTRGWLGGAELSPEGPSGLGPLHLRQASGLAGGR